MKPNESKLLSVVRVFATKDCQLERFVSGTPPSVLGMLQVSEPNQNDYIRAFKMDVVEDAIELLGAGVSVVSASDWNAAIVEATERASMKHVVTPWTSICPIATQLAITSDALGRAGIQLDQQQHAYDTLPWPRTTKGYFKLKNKFPSILSDPELVEA